MLVQKGIKVIWPALLLTLSMPVFADIIATPADGSKYYSARPEPIESDCDGVKPGVYESANSVEFMTACPTRGISEGFCNSLTHPNSQSIHEFRCTYPGKPHVLIPTDKKLWEHAF